MKSNRIIWGFVALTVLTTIAVTFGTLDSHSQQKPQPTPTQQDKGFEDLSKYAVADYDAPESRDAEERDKRGRAGKRYDGQHLIIPNPHPNDGGAMLYDELPPPPLLPVAESNLIVVGKIVNANAFVSNDKRSVYTEFAISVDDVIKNDLSVNLEKGAVITTDRVGGMVRYSDGRKLIYRVAERKMLWLGGEYILFLAQDKGSPNYRLVTGYELTATNDFSQIDTGRKFDQYKGVRKSEFIETIRAEVARQPR